MCDGFIAMPTIIYPPPLHASFIFVFVYIAAKVYISKHPSQAVLWACSVWLGVLQDGVSSGWERGHELRVEEREPH